MPNDHSITGLGKALSDSRTDTAVAACDEDNSRIVRSLSHKGKGIFKNAY